MDGASILWNLTIFFLYHICKFTGVFPIPNSTLLPWSAHREKFIFRCRIMFAKSRLNGCGRYCSSWSDQNAAKEHKVTFLSSKLTCVAKETNGQGVEMYRSGEQNRVPNDLHFDIVRNGKLNIPVCKNLAVGILAVIWVFNAFTSRRLGSEQVKILNKHWWREKARSPTDIGQKRLYKRH